MALIVLTARSKNGINKTAFSYGFQSDRISDVIVKQSFLPALNGTSQFAYLNLDGINEFWTVDQTVAQIIAMTSSLAITGTNSETFGIDIDATTYVLIGNNAGTLEVLTQAGTAFAPIHASGAASAATFTLGAGERIYIDAITADHTLATCVFLDIDSVATATTGFSTNIDVISSLTGNAIGYSIEIDGAASDANGSVLIGFSATLTCSAGRADVVGFGVNTDGTMTSADTITGFYHVATDAITTANLYGFRANFTGVTHTSGDLFGMYMDTTHTVSAGSSTGIALVIGSKCVALSIDAGTTYHVAGNIIDINLDVNSSTVNSIYQNIAVGTALSVAEKVCANHVVIDGAAGDNATSELVSFYTTGGGTSAGIVTAFKAEGTFTRGLDLNGATITTDIRLGKGGLIHNTSNAIMTFTEAGFDFVGNVTVNGTTNYVLDNSAGATDTYTATMAPALTVYTKGQLFVFYPLTANTTACTLAINGLAAKNIKLSSGADPDTNDLLANMPSLLSYDGTSFILCNPY